MIEIALGWEPQDSAVWIPYKPVMTFGGIEQDHVFLFMVRQEGRIAYLMYTQKNAASIEGDLLDMFEIVDPFRDQVADYPFFVETGRNERLEYLTKWVQARQWPHCVFANGIGFTTKNHALLAKLKS